MPLALLLKKQEVKNPIQTAPIQTAPDPRLNRAVPPQNNENRKEEVLITGDNYQDHIPRNDDHSDDDDKIYRMKPDIVFHFPFI